MYTCVHLSFRRRIFCLVPRGVFTEMSDPLSRMPRGLVRVNSVALFVSTWFLTRAVVLESGLETFFYRLGLGHRTRQMFKLVSTESSNICFFFLFQNKDSLVPQMGNVIAIGLTPSRTGIVIGPSRTGIVIGPLLNAQLRHMSVRAAWRHKLSLFWPQTRCRQVA